MVRLVAGTFILDILLPALSLCGQPLCKDLERARGEDSSGRAGYFVYQGEAPSLDRSTPCLEFRPKCDVDLIQGSTTRRERSRLGVYRYMSYQCLRTTCAWSD
ncbi:hypothetical protein F5B19DRAFT_449424 [Rostrohypoxylon terebratum]|nr:hypothetical protein F5B19DRAFT_449424 [Rostrohypoxylon terebratum]